MSETKVETQKTEVKEKGEPIFNSTFWRWTALIGLAGATMLLINSAGEETVSSVAGPISTEGQPEAMKALMARLEAIQAENAALKSQMVDLQNQIEKAKIAPVQEVTEPRYRHPAAGHYGRPHYVYGGGRPYYGGYPFGHGQPGCAGVFPGFDPYYGYGGGHPHYGYGGGHPQYGHGGHGGGYGSRRVIIAGGGGGHPGFPGYPGHPGQYPGGRGGFWDRLEDAFFRAIDRTSVVYRGEDVGVVVGGRGGHFPGRYRF